jgi:hypothetical protein
MPDALLEVSSIGTGRHYPARMSATVCASAGPLVSCEPDGGRRPAVHGKLLAAGNRKVYVRGVTYGSFLPDAKGNEYQLCLCCSVSPCSAVLSVSSADRSTTGDTKLNNRSTHHYLSATSSAGTAYPVEVRLDPIHQRLTHPMWAVTIPHYWATTFVPAKFRQTKVLGSFGKH